jgi:hypothetical protein
MKALSSPRFVAIYSGALTLVFVATVFWGFLRMRNPHFDIITARRINVVEPDGTGKYKPSHKCLNKIMQQAR